MSYILDMMDELQHQTMGYYSVLERNELSNHKKAWRKLQGMLLSERSQSEKTTYCRVPTVWYSGNGETMATVKRDLWLPGVKRVCGGDEEAEHRAFWRQWKYSLWYLSLYICSNLCNLPALIMMCQWRFIGSDKCTLLVGVWTVGEALHVQGQEVNANSMCLTLSFALNLKLL